MYYIIKTQHLENYGVFDKPAVPCWRAKGGDTFVLYQGVPIADPHRMLKNFIAEVCVKHTPGGCIYPIGEPVEIPSYSVQSYKQCADEIDKPWFCFVNVTGVDTWDIESVCIESDLYIPKEMFNEQEIKNALANKIEQLTEDADG